jgi:hypothetical protein
MMVSMLMSCVWLMWVQSEVSCVLSTVHVVSSGLT